MPGPVCGMHVATFRLRPLIKWAPKHWHCMLTLSADCRGMTAPPPPGKTQRDQVSTLRVARASRNSAVHRRSARCTHGCTGNSTIHQAIHDVALSACDRSSPRLVSSWHCVQADTQWQGVLYGTGQASYDRVSGNIMVATSHIYCSGCSRNVIKPELRKNSSCRLGQLHSGPRHPNERTDVDSSMASYAYVLLARSLCRPTRPLRMRGQLMLPVPRGDLRRHLRTHVVTVLLSQVDLL